MYKMNLDRNFLTEKKGFIISSFPLLYSFEKLFGSSQQVYVPK